MGNQFLHNLISIPFTKVASAHPSMNYFQIFLVSYDRWDLQPSIHMKISRKCFTFSYLADYSKVSTFFLETLGIHLNAFTLVHSKNYLEFFLKILIGGYIRVCKCTFWWFNAALGHLWVCRCRLSQVKRGWTWIKLHDRCKKFVKCFTLYFLSEKAQICLMSQWCTVQPKRNARAI